MKKLISVLILCLALFAEHIPLATASASKPEGMCPVMPGNRVKKKFYVDYQGKRVYLCCRSCVKAFKKNPESYLPVNSQ